MAWSYSSVLDLMLRAGAVAERNRRPWTDCTTATRGQFLAYDCRTDAFVARPSPPVLRPSRSKGGLGSFAREVCQKRHRNLDGEPPALVLLSANIVRTPAASSGTGYGTASWPSWLLLPPLGFDMGPGANPATTQSQLGSQRDNGYPRVGPRPRELGRPGLASCGPT